MTCSRPVFAALLLLTACGNPLAPTRSLPNAVAPFLRLPDHTSTWTLHPFGAGPPLTGSAVFQLYRTGQVDFPTWALRETQNRLQNPLIAVNLVETTAASNLAAGGRSFRAEFAVNGVPLEGAALTMHRLSDGSPFVLGAMPDLSAKAVAAAPTTWPDADQTMQAVQRSLTLPGSETLVHISDLSRRYTAGQDHISAVWRGRATVNGMPYAFLGTDKGAVSLQPDYFDATGTAKVYPRNVLETVMTATSLPDLNADGTLTSTYLQAVVPPAVEAAKEPTFTYDYPVADPRYAEAAAYAHTQDQYAWFTTLGFAWYGPKPLQIKLHATPGGTTNNALFIPGDADSGLLPSINLGDGDGNTLQNLATDADVPKHELGHHIVYQTLKTTSGESLVLHEALADTFVFLHNDNACLGESICPEGSGACILEGQCLRTGDNTFAYQDSNWQAWLGGTNTLGHKHSQVLSGLIWDMRKSKVMSTADLAQLTLKAVSYFKADSGLRDFLLAVLTADRELFQCKYDTQLRNGMKARHLLSLIQDVSADCNSVPLPSGLEGGALTASATAAAVTPLAPVPGSSANKKSCAVVDFGATPSTASWVLTILLGLLPVILAAPKRVPAKAKARRADKKRK